MTKPQVFHNEGRIVRELAKRKWLDLSLSSHARREMRNDSLDLLDIRHVLRTGAVIGSEMDLKCGGEKWTVEGRVDDGRIVDVVIKVREKEGGILVITVFEVKL